MRLITLDALDLALAALLVLAVGALSMVLRLGLERSLAVGALRTTVQLLAVGLVLRAVFANADPLWLALMATVMLLVAGREVMARQRRRFAGPWGYGLGTLAMLASSFSITLVALTVIVRVEPWYTPQYAVPLLGMLLGNTMSGIALGLDRLTQGAWERRGAIEAHLTLGHRASVAIADLRREAARTGMIPIINAMAAAGIVSLPGMMTGQILAGAPPVEAVKYQILIMFLITAGTGFGTVVAVWLGARRLFDDRERLRLDRLARSRG